MAPELLFLIFEYLPYDKLYDVARVCKQWRSIACRHVIRRPYALEFPRNKYTTTGVNVQTVGKINNVGNIHFDFRGLQLGNILYPPQPPVDYVDLTIPLFVDTVIAEDYLCIPPWKWHHLSEGDRAVFAWRGWQLQVTVKARDNDIMDLAYDSLEVTPRALCKHLYMIANKEHLHEHGNGRWWRNGVKCYRWGPPYYY